MNYKLMLASFITVFLAELGDKTQLTLFCLSAKDPKAWLSVLIGGSVALVSSTAIAVVLGMCIGVRLPETIIRYSAGVLFIVFGVLMLFNKM